MNETDKLQAEISQEIAELEEKITTMQANSGPVAPDNAIGRLTRLDEMGSKGINDAALQNAQVKLSELKFKLATVGTPLWEG